MKNAFVMAWLVFANTAAYGGTSLILVPGEMAVFQRNEATQSQVMRFTVKRASPGIVQARLVVHAGKDFVSNVEVGSDPFVITSAPIPQGGWYRAEVVQSGDSQTMPVRSPLEKIGVGDVYLVAGQSNAANWAESAKVSNSGIASMMDSATGEWQTLRDPQPFTDGWSGSTWPEFADLLAQSAGYPIGIVNTAIGGTLIEQWQPQKFSSGNYPLFDRLLKAANELRSLSGFRLILWHQGEGDLGLDSTYRRYFLSLQGSLDAALGGEPVKWMIATASFSPPDLSAADCGTPLQPSGGLALRLVQSLLPDGISRFAGPDSDDLVGAGNRYAGPMGMCIHFTSTAQSVMARRWVAAVKDLSLGNRSFSR
jgi:hypothetical protein